jgi:hypothetical protein
MVGFFLGLLWLAVVFVFRVFLTLGSWVLWLLLPHWLLFVVTAFIATAATPAYAGWLEWLWGADTRHLERSAELAHEAARVAREAAQAQAQQASAQAEQNTRLAETLSQLSSERSNLADHLHALTVLRLQDSQWAAALTASGPLLICLTVLLVAGLALWLVTRSCSGQQTELTETVDLLVEELAAGVADPQSLAGTLARQPRLSHRDQPILVEYAGGNPMGNGTDEPEDAPMPF